MYETKVCCKKYFKICIACQSVIFKETKVTELYNIFVKSIETNYDIVDF